MSICAFFVDVDNQLFYYVLNMKAAKIILIIIASSLMYACKNEPKSLASLFENRKEYNLRTLNFPNDSLGRPDFIYSFKNFIIISEPMNEYLLAIYDIDNQSIKRILRKGQGPNELLDIQQLDGWGNNAFFVKSTFEEKGFIFHQENSFSSHLRMSVPENTITMYYDYTDSLIISSKRGEKRHSMYNLETSQQIDFGIPLEFMNLPQGTISSIFQGFCTGSSMRKRFAWFSTYGDVFEIYGYKDLDNIKNIKQYVGLMPIITMAEGNVPVFSLESKIGFPSLTSNDDYIFVLYSENTLVDALTLRDEVFFSNKILKLDWDGNFVKLLELDYPIRSITYNKDKGILFCLGFDNEHNYKLYYLKLSDMD
jgi:hypothetical protein